MYKSHASSVNYPGQMYRPLGEYYGVMPGQVGTVTSAQGETLSIPVPAFAPPMNVQSVPYDHVPYIGTPLDLTHGLRSDQLTSGYFGVNNAYPSSCSTFRNRRCDGVVPCHTIPVNDRVDCDAPMPVVHMPVAHMPVAPMPVVPAASVAHHRSSSDRPAHYSGGVGDQCADGAEGSCHDGLVCVPDSSADGLLGGHGRCMVPVPAHRHS